MNIAILIIGYDPYVDVWDDYFNLLNKYWKVRPKTYLATSSLTPVYEGVNVIPTGDNSEWSTKARVALENISEDYVILLLEDFFTTRQVNSSKIYEVVELMKTEGITYCKLLSPEKMKGEAFLNNSHIKIIPKSKDYGICLQPALWEKKFLLELIGKDNYNPWLFEFKMIELKLQNKNRIDSIQVTTNVLEITHGIVQGKYLPKCIRVFKKQNYTFNTSHQVIMSPMVNFKYRLKCSMSLYTPSWLKEYLKKIGRMMGVDFVSDRILGRRK